MKTKVTFTAKSEAMKTQIENYKMGIEYPITQEESVAFIGNDYNFRNILSGMDVGFQEEECDFPTVQDATFSIEKVKKAGTIVQDYETWKCKTGQFIIRVRYNYIHPSNFNQNNYNIIKEFNYAQ